MSPPKSDARRAFLDLVESAKIGFFRYPDLVPVAKETVQLAQGLCLHGDDDELVLPFHEAEAWPVPDAPALPAPESVLRCAFRAPEYLVPRLRIDGGTEWRRTR